MEENALIQILNSELALDWPEKLTLQEVRLRLKNEINHLIREDFQKLVSILYRVDVNERKLKFLLQENVGEEAGVIIADLIMERQLQKIKSREQYRQRDQNISEEDSW